MSLDLFATNIDDAVAYAGRVSAPELPSTFSENIDDAFSKGRLVSQSISGNLRKSRALSDYMDEVRAKTGDPLQLPETAGIEDMNAKVRALKAGNPALDVSELTDEDIQRRADEIGVRHLADSASLARRERTTGGAVGSFLGSAGAALTDPVNMVAFPLAAPESLGILGTALAWGAIGAGSQTAIEALNASSMERIQPGYGASGEAIGNILETGAFAGVLGGSLKGLSNLWSRAKTGQWPRTVRDAGNVVDSEVQIATTNPLPGVEGEATHRTALNKAIDDLANNRPVDVDGIVPPEQFAARDAAIDPVLTARDASVEAQATARAAADDALASGKAQPDLPFAQTEAAANAELHAATLTEGIQNIAKMAGHDMPADEAAKIAARISQLNDPDKARAILDEVFMRPQTIADTLPAVEKPVKPLTDAATPDAVNALRDDLTPAKIEEARANPDMEETVARDLDKLMLERPDMEVPTGVTVDAEGRTVPTSRKVEDVVAEADARSAAAKEIEACVGPYPAAEAAA